ncbi:MAG: hypothetical protein KDB88_08680 [Flavobacteriales bacterium]|nr:hypothetical protein [Flavobacteriales bacterium]
MKHTSLLFAVLATPTLLFAWGPDTPVQLSSNSGPIHSIQAPGGEVVVAYADTVANDGVLIRFMLSSDEGATWSMAPYQVDATGVSPRIKLLRSASELYCAYLLNDTVRVFHPSTGTIGAYLDYAAEEFDAVMTDAGWLYLFIQLPGTDDIRRAGSNDGGLTWGGDMASVTGQGAVPRVTLGPGNSVTLNYYGPVLADRPKSKIRAAGYTEAAPGDLNVGVANFQDVVTDVTRDKWRFGSVAIGNVVWFFWEEGPALGTALKGLVSLNSGQDYGTAFTLSVGAGEVINGFQALGRTVAGSTRVELVYGKFTTPGQSDPVLDRLVHRWANTTLPEAFSAEEAISEHSPRVVPIAEQPALVALDNGKLGAYWSHRNGTEVDLFWDLQDLSTAVEPDDRNAGFHVTGPLNEELVIRSERNVQGEAIVMDASGRTVRTQRLSLASDIPSTLPIGQLASGAYVLIIRDRSGLELHGVRFVKP